MAVLSQVLTLVAPTGMTQDERKSWLRVAYDTLNDVPLYLLQRAEKAVRGKVDHPARIVRAILDEVADDMAWRKRHAVPMPERRTDPQPMLIEDQSAVPIDQARRWTMPYLDWGLRQGWVSQTDYDTILAEREAQGMTDAG